MVFSLLLAFQRMVGPAVVWAPAVLVLVVLAVLRRVTGRGDCTGTLPAVLTAHPRVVRLAIAGFWLVAVLILGRAYNLPFWFPPVLFLALSSGDGTPLWTVDQGEDGEGRPAGMGLGLLRVCMSVLLVAGLAVFGLLAWFVLPLKFLEKGMEILAVPPQGQGAAAAWVLMFSCPAGASIGLALGLWAVSSRRHALRRYAWSLGIIAVMGLVILCWAASGVATEERRKSPMRNVQQPVRERRARRAIQVPALFSAAFKEDLAEIERLLDEGTPVDLRLESDTVLTWAASRRKLEVAGLMLRKGADVNAKGEAGHTSLVGALSVWDIAMARLLITSGADLAVPGRDGKATLIGMMEHMIGVRPQYKRHAEELIKLLRQHGAPEPSAE